MEAAFPVVLSPPTLMLDNVWPVRLAASTAPSIPAPPVSAINTYSIIVATLTATSSPSNTMPSTIAVFYALVDAIDAQALFAPLALTPTPSIILNASRLAC